MNDVDNSDLVPLGVGIGIGALGVWAVVQLFPLFVLGGAGFLIFKGLEHTQAEEKSISWQETGQNKN